MRFVPVPSPRYSGGRVRVRGFSYSRERHQIPMPAEQRLLIFANPISGRGRGKKIAERLEQCLTLEGYTVQVYLQRADQIPTDQIPGNALAAIVIGGDGTLRTVAERLLRESETLKPRAEAVGDAPGSPYFSSQGRAAEEPGASATPSASGLNERSTPPLLIIPMGTANLMGRHLGIHWDDAHLEDQILHTLRTGRHVHLDTALANGRLLLLIAGVGLDAQVVHELEKRRTGPISYLSYLKPILHALITYHYPPLIVTVDEKKIFGPSPALVFIGNVPEYGTGFPMLPLATPVDRLLDVCVLPCRSRAEVMSHALHAVTGDHLHRENVVYVRGSRIRVEAASPIPVQVDGESAGHTPLAVDLLPTRLTFIVPSRIQAGAQR